MDFTWTAGPSAARRATATPAKVPPEPTKSTNLQQQRRQMLPSQHRNGHDVSIRECTAKSRADPACSRAAVPSQRRETHVFQGVQRQTHQLYAGAGGLPEQLRAGVLRVGAQVAEQLELVGGAPAFFRSSGRGACAEMWENAQGRDMDFTWSAR